MSEPLDDRTLDALIDESARALTTVEAPPDLRARVFSRLHEDPDRGWKPRWLVPGIAIASACVAAIAIYVGSGFSRSNDVGDVGSGLSRSSTPQIRLKPDPTTATITATTTATTPNVGSDFRRSSDSTIVQSEPPPGFESIGAAALTIDALGVTGLAPPAGMSVESIPVESIEIDALGTE